LIRVYATYGAYNNKDAPLAELDLKLWPSELKPSISFDKPNKRWVATGTSNAVAYLIDPTTITDKDWKSGEYYTMDFVAAKEAAYQLWNDAKPKAVKQTINVYYTVDIGTVEAALGVNGIDGTVGKGLFGEYRNVTKKGTPGISNGGFNASTGLPDGSLGGDLTYQGLFKKIKVNFTY